ncbi:MAG: hypothetical protein LBL67_03225 [Coriobacteriales bacterium]|nr:hypothetical protein [Coriobacteriales bacterium]
MKHSEHYGDFTATAHGKSKTCVGRSGKPLTEYPSEAAARESARYLGGTHGKMVPYQCQKCGKWHLSPASRVTPSSLSCGCTDSHGAPKRLYATRKAAERRAKIIRDERGQDLKVYPCPVADGYHLTHRDNR